MIRFALAAGFTLAVALAVAMASPLLAQSRIRGEGQMCGGIAGFQCGPGLMCDQTPGMCRGADISGICITAPEACTFIFQPVCGCDGKTYGNDCERQMAQAAKDHDGPCNSPPR